MSLSRNRWVALGIATVVLADWVTKFLVQNRIPYHSYVHVVEGWLGFTHRRNPGVAFSWMADFDSPLRTPLLAALSLAGIALTIVLLRAATDGWTRGGAALVLAGAVANLGDRLANGAVTDFIHVAFFPYVFNVADAAISVGAVLLVARLLLDRGRGDAPAPTFT